MITGAGIVAPAPHLSVRLEAPAQNRLTSPNGGAVPRKSAITRCSNGPEVHCGLFSSGARTTAVGRKPPVGGDFRTLAGATVDLVPRSRELRAELLRRARRDREARCALDDPPTSEQWDVVKAVDAHNVPWLEATIAEHGWLGASLVGVDGAHAAWLLAQHAPHYLQRRWLPLLQGAVEAGEAAVADLAYLDDRVRVGEQRPQLHGTQWFVQDGVHRLWALKDPHQVNDRRAALGLPPLADEDIINAWPPDTALDAAPKKRT